MKNIMRHYFEQGDGFQGKSTWSFLMNSLRRISKRLELSMMLHKLRQLFHFGPWRTIPIYLIRKLRPCAEMQHENEISLLGLIDANAIAEEIRQNSVAIVGVLPADYISDLRSITDKLPCNEYQFVHQVNEGLCRLTEDPGIKSVLRAYLKCEPVLLEASLFVAKPELSRRPVGQNLFHFDYAGWESLTVFLYLTDITESSSYHIVAKGSHRNRNFRDVLRGPLTVEEGQLRYGEAVQAITGPAGTLFFENTEAYHRRHRGNERRVMLNLLYASHRSLLSYGRASQAQIEVRDRAFEKLGVR